MCAFRKTRHLKTKTKQLTVIWGYEDSLADKVLPWRHEDQVFRSPAVSTVPGMVAGEGVLWENGGRKSPKAW